MKITIQTIPHTSQRYNTIGDWTDKDIFVSEMGNPDYEFLVAVHELIEWYLCNKKGVTQESVDAFDMNFKGEGEPGASPDAPCYAEHDLATRFEYSLANFIGVDWKTYDETVNEITKVARINNNHMDENKTDTENGGQTQEPQQSDQPEGTPSVPGGEQPADAQHEEGGTGESVGDGAPKDGVQE